MISSTVYKAESIRPESCVDPVRYIPYDLDYGLIYKRNCVVKVRFDHEKNEVVLSEDEFVLPKTSYIISAVEIMRNKLVFVYTYNWSEQASQCVYLRKWSCLAENYKESGILPSDFEAAGEFSGQYLDEKHLCIMRTGREEEINQAVSRLEFTIKLLVYS